MDTEELEIPYIDQKIITIVVPDKGSPSVDLGGVAIGEAIKILNDTANLLEHVVYLPEISSNGEKVISVEDFLYEMDED